MVNILLNLIKHQRPDINKIYLHVNDPLESKYQLLIKGTKKLGMKTFENPKALIDYSHAIDHVYKNLEDYNPTKKIKILIVFDNMILDMEPNKK